MRSVRILFFVVATLLSTYLFKKEFKVPPIHEDIPFNPLWESKKPSDEIQEILSHPFTYLTHGNQCSVFQSENGEYILKLFRYKRSPFPIIQNIKSLFAKSAGKNPKCDLFTKLNKTFFAARIAATDASDYTGVIFSHLNLSQNTLPITEIRGDKTYYLPMDSYRFCLQKKATPFKKALLEAKDNPDEMHQLIDSLVHLLTQRLAKGISNSDPNLAPNFGFINRQAIEIDFGNYLLVDYSPEEEQKEITIFLSRFEDWLNKYAPEHVKYLLEIQNKYTQRGSKIEF